MENTVNFLKGVEIFSSLCEGEIRQIVNNARSVDFDAGNLLFREGDEGKELYIVENGSIAITIRLPDGNEKEIAEIKTGDFFGEMSIFEEAPRSATCYAKTDTRLLMINQDEFFQMIDASPDIAVKIMYKMLTITTRRLRNTNEFVADTVRWGEEARRRAITDELTGVYNRRYLDEAFKEQFALAREKQLPLAVIMVDLDHFREINEAFGHDTGDKIIHEAVRVFKRNLRPNDILARYGGDEFSVLMPDTTLEEGLEIAQRICDETAGLDILKGKGGAIERITTSQGIAAYPDCAVSMEELRALADKALYRAKEEGRNRVVAAAKR